MYLLRSCNARWHWLPSCSRLYLRLPWWKLTRCIPKVIREEDPSLEQLSRHCRGFLKFGCHRSGSKVTFSILLLTEGEDDEMLTELCSSGSLGYVTSWVTFRTRRSCFFSLSFSFSFVNRFPFIPSKYNHRYYGPRFVVTQWKSVWKSYNWICNERGSPNRTVRCGTRYS